MQASVTLRSDQLQTTDTPPPPSTITASRVFIQILSENQRLEAAALQAGLRKAGIAAPGIENVVGTSLRSNKAAPAAYKENVLLVFHESDASLADQIRDIAAKNEVQLRVEKRWGQAKYASVPNGQLEIWFGDAHRCSPPSQVTDPAELRRKSKCEHAKASTWSSASNTDANCEAALEGKSSVCAETESYANSGFGLWDGRGKIADCVCVP